MNSQTLIEFRQVSSQLDSQNTKLKDVLEKLKAYQQYMSEMSNQQEDTLEENLNAITNKQLPITTNLASTQQYPTNQFNYQQPYPEFQNQNFLENFNSINQQNFPKPQNQFQNQTFGPDLALNQNYSTNNVNFQQPPQQFSNENFVIQQQSPPNFINNIYDFQNNQDCSIRSKSWKARQARQMQQILPISNQFSSPIEEQDQDNGNMLQNIYPDQEPDYLFQRQQSPQSDIIETNNKSKKQSEPLELPLLSDLIEFSIESKQQFIQLSKTIAQEIPIVINLETKDLPNEASAKRRGIDLICVIDTSTSMEGEQLSLVRETLLYLLNELHEEDRIALISFNHISEVLCDLTYVTSLQINRLKRLINSLYASGSTDITIAMNDAFKLLSERQNVDNIASIFLLSDGQDQGAERNVERNYQAFQFQQQFVIHTFGYGANHDPTLMRDIAKIKDGSFYYIADLELVEQCFIDAVVGLFSVIAQNIEITVTAKQTGFSNDLRISKAYGNWIFDDQTKSYKLGLNQLLCGAKKNFVLELNIPPIKRVIPGEQKSNVTVVEVELKANSVDETQPPYEKILQLKIDFFEEEEEMKLNEDQLKMNTEVILNHLRVKGSDALSLAREHADRQQFKEAQDLLDDVINEIKESGLQNELILQVLFKDLVTAKDNCNPYQYSDGRTMIIARQYQHLNQQSQPMAEGTMEEMTLYANTQQTIKTINFRKKDQN